MTKNSSLALAVIVVALALPGGAIASADAVFSKLNGNFRGSGFALVDGGEKKRRISCQLVNSYSASTSKLKMTGRCASSQGATNVAGTISHAGGKITGSYLTFRNNVKMTSSSGTLGKKSLTILASFVDEKNGRLHKVRQIIQITAAGFQADFFTYNNKTKKYEAAGVVAFRRR